MPSPNAVIELPTASDSITNKPAMQKSSLYHTCRSVLCGLESVPGFERYLEQPEGEGSLSSKAQNDPVSKLWHICRQGSSLCLLFDALKLDLANDPHKDCNPNKPKACVYHFIVACRDYLHFPQDMLFTVTDLYQDDTNGFVKVVNAVKEILDLLEKDGVVSTSIDSQSDPNAPKDMRDKVVFELLETERKYVQDLESLQHYMHEAQKVLPPNTLHQLFGNLNALVDFQRRFLIQAEDNADRPPQEQRFGNLFITLEEAFAVYEPFCANYETAQDLVVQETAKLQKLSDIMSPTYELPSMLIKPVQRVCKYPLLLQEMLKATPEDWPYYEEMKQGLEAIQRVASKVNETRRRQENVMLVDDLVRRVEESWKTSVTQYGLLQLHDRFVIHRNEVDYDVYFYLFEKALLICRDEKDANKKGNAISIKKKKNAKDGSGGLIVKGLIAISQIAQISDTSQNGKWSLRLYWSERDGKPHSLQYFNLKSFIIKCRNDEQLKQWESAFNKLVQIEKRASRESKATAESQATRPAQPASAPASIRGPRTPGYYSDDTPSPLSYGEEDEEEAEEESDEFHSSDDEHGDAYKERMRSRSQSAHLYRTRQRTADGDHYGRRPVPTRSMSSALANGRQHPYGNAMPGMSLPPLPRSDIDPSGMSSSPPPSYPPSPMTSYPSSPSVSTRSSSGSSHLWQRRTPGDQNLLPSELIGRSLLGDCADEYSALYNNEAKLPPDEVSQTRSRSQSSPDIHQPGMFDDAPDMPAAAGIYQDAAKRSSSNGCDYGRQADNIKVKLNYMGEIYVVVVPLDIEYEKLMERIESKMRLHGQTLNNSSISLKYQDEDGDLITISSNEDVQMGFENRGANNTVNLYMISTAS